MTKEQELQILKEIEYNSLLFGKTIIIWKQAEGLVYFNDKDLEHFFARIFKYQMLGNKKHFNYEDIKTVLKNIKTVSFK